MTALSEPKSLIVKFVAGCVAVLLLWLIATRSLVAFLDTADPESALRLSASNAGARLSLANKAIEDALKAKTDQPELRARHRLAARRHVRAFANG